MKTLKAFFLGATLVVIAMLGFSPACMAEETIEENNKTKNADNQKPVTEQTTEETTLKNVKQEVKEAAQAMKAYSFDQRDKAINNTKAALDKLDKRIDELEKEADKNWDNMNQAARNKTRNTLKALRKQRTELAEWYGSLKNSSAGAWDEVKKGFSDAYTSLHNAWEKAEKEFKSNKKPDNEKN